MQLLAQFLLSMLVLISTIVVGGAVACLPVRIHNIAIYARGEIIIRPLRSVYPLRYPRPNQSDVHRLPPQLGPSGECVAYSQVPTEGGRHPGSER